MRVKVAATLFGLTFAVAACLTAQEAPPPAGGAAPGGRTPRRRVRARPAAAAGRPRADRAREDAVRHQLHRLSRRRPPRRRHGRTQPAAVAGCLERPRRRTDRPDHSGQPQGRRHAGHRDESRGRGGRGRLRAQRSGDHRQTGHASVDRPGGAECAGRQCRRRPGLLRREVRQLPLRHRRSARASRPESPIPRRCRTPGSPAAGAAAAADAAARAGEPSARTVTVAVTLPSGERTEGRLVRIDDFLVTVGLADGTLRTFRRDGDVPKVEVHDPMQAHRDLLAVYTDKDMHDVTAYLVTLK